MNTESEDLLRYCLTLEHVLLPEHPPSLPAPLDLAVGLNEVLLLEGLTPEEGEAIFSVGSTLKGPVAGEVRHWGKNSALLPRDHLFNLRRQIAFISPRRVLLHRFTLSENIAFGPCYYRGHTLTQVLQDQAELIDQLELEPYLSLLPAQVPEDVHFRTIWARELVKAPELILAVVAEPLLSEAAQDMLVRLLQNYQASKGVAMLLVGESLENFYPLGHRLLRLRDHRLTEDRLLNHQARPLVAFLPLV